MPGSGKGTIAKLLSKELGYKIIEFGQLFREISAKKKFTLAEVNKDKKLANEIDKIVDNKIISSGKKDKLIIDARMGFHFVPKSIKLFINVDPKIAANRVFRDKRKAEEFTSEKDAYESLRKRAEFDRKRLLDLYHVDIYNLTCYDFIIDSSYLDEKQVLKSIMGFLLTKMPVTAKRL